MPETAQPNDRVAMLRGSGVPAVARALREVDTNVAQFGEALFPDDVTHGGRYPLRPARDGLAAGCNDGWTTSFWTGQVWLAHLVTGDGRYRRLGEAHLDSFAHRLDSAVGLETHDLGFLYTLGALAPTVQLPGSAAADRGARVALRAADLLMERYLDSAGIIQAWGSLDDPEQAGRAIIDSLMNLPLLFWASGMPGRSHYAEAAARHARQLRDHNVRDDDTTHHTYYFDVESGLPRFGRTQQGHADDSCWARGQAWGIYGFALAFRHTGDPTLRDTSRRLADYFLAHLPHDRVCYWDLVFGEGSGEPRDSSAAAIAASGLQELADALEGDDPGAASRYRRSAVEILASLASGYAPPEPSPGAPLLLHGVYDIPTGTGVDEGSLWGDYFYLEALVRQQNPDWPTYWEART